MDYYPSDTSLFIMSEKYNCMEKWTAVIIVDFKFVSLHQNKERMTERERCKIGGKSMMDILYLGH